MSEDSNREKPSAAASTGEAKPKPDARKERLAAALRANLRRRKDQTRARKSDAD